MCYYLFIILIRDADFLWFPMCQVFCRMRLQEVLAMTADLDDISGHLLGPLSRLVTESHFESLQC